MNRFLLAGAFLLLGPAEEAAAQVPATAALSGTVRNRRNGESLIGVTVSVVGQPGATTSNAYGYYVLTVPRRPVQVVFSYAGFAADTLALTPTADQVLDVRLTELPRDMETVVVRGQSKGRTVAGSQMGVERLSTREMNRIPVLLGEKDVLKTIQLLPGIKSAGDGNAGFYVRGGGSDQNLILLDEATVYNPSHLLGFFSSFNSDAIKDVTVYKGGMPAQYGGRLSSVVDIRMNDGNNQELAGSGSVGFISAKAALEGPIQRNKSSFLVTARRTYADLFLRASPDSSINQSRLYFYDLNLKMNYELGAKDRIYVSGYFGKDRLAFDDQVGVDWGNATGTLRWNHVFNSRLFANTSLIYSNYDYSIRVRSGANDFKVFSQVRDWNLKQDYELAAGRGQVRFGWSSNYHAVRPGEITASESSGINSLQQQRRYGLENAIYLNHSWKPTPKLSVSYGLRMSNFLVLGKGDYYGYDAAGKITDTVSYRRGEVVKAYWNPEPRVSLGYRLNNASSFKAAYVRNTQPIHLLSNSTSALPTDKWLLSSNVIKPQVSDQVSVGYYHDFGAAYELTSEVYYKWLQNQIDYRNGADLFSNRPIETELLYGKGRAYGWETQLRKKSGRLTGWVSYTLSKSERQIDGINNGAWYRARQDRTHDVSVVAMYQLNKKWSLSANWVYYTGDAVTFPNGKYTVGGITTYYYTNRNGYRMPDYHRLDLGATMQLRQRGKWRSELSFGLYNAYGRENAYTITFRDNKDDPSRTEAVQTTLFRWIPSVSYQFKF